MLYYYVYGARRDAWHVNLKDLRDFNDNDNVNANDNNNISITNNIINIIIIMIGHK